MMETSVQAIALTDDGLPTGWGPWDVPAGWQVLPDGGPEGTPALALRREDPAAYLNARLPIRLAEESRHRLRLRMLLEPGSDHRAGANAGIEFFDAAGRFLGGSYLPAVRTPGEWTAGETEFTVPRYTAECRVMCYLGAGKAGAARFANLALTPASFRWTAYPLTPVRDELPAGGGMVPFGCYVLPGAEPDPAAGWRCRAALERDGETLFQDEVAVVDGRFSLSLPMQPAGPATLRLTLCDAEGCVHGETRAPVTLTPAPAPGMPDVRGRMWRDGRPYLPVGLYLGLLSREELAEIADSPFNCVLPYSSPVLTLDGTPAGVATVREALDACHAHGLSVIFSLSNTYDDWHFAFTDALGAHGGEAVMAEAVRAFGEHPALLAWYLNDEQPLERLPMLLERRRALRVLDPQHPIYSVMCQVPELPFYTPLCDIYGIDPYPIVDPASDTIRASRYAHDMALRAAGTTEGVALWTVVQAHNNGNYDPRANTDPAAYAADYRDPSFDEILALALLAAIRGAKGFLFYSYFDLGRPAFRAATRSRRWADLCRVGQTLRALESVLLADTPAPLFTLRVTQGEVEARAFRDDAGHTAVLLAAIGPGPCRAELTLEGAFRSQCGHTEQVDGRYVFHGEDVCGDVLVSA